MLSKLLTVVLLVSLASCKKEYKKSDNEKIETVENLNKGNPKLIIEKLTDPVTKSPKAGLSSRDLYYLASAYAQEANVDVYSLYSVMEIQLFHKKALDWSDLSKEKNPYMKFMKTQAGGDTDAKKLKKEQMWEKLLPELKRKFELDERQKTLEELRENYECRCEDLTAEAYKKMDNSLAEKAKKILDSNISVEDFESNTTWGEVVYSEVVPEEFNSTSTAYYVLADFHRDQVYLTLKKNEFLNPIKAKNLLNGVGWEMLLMNILWNTYESIPLMKKLPELTVAQQESLSQGLEVNLSLLKDKEFKDVSLKNLVILTSVSLLSIYTESFDLESITSMKDLYCYFEPNAVLDNYGLIRKRILFMKKAYDALEIKDKNYQAHKAELDKLDQYLVEELTEDQKIRYMDSVKKFQVDSCLNG